MVGILVITHGDLARGFQDSVELIAGEYENFVTRGLYSGDNIDEFSEKVLEDIINLDKGKGVLVFSDLFCASPYNAAALNSKKLTEHKYRLVSGVSLPMLLEAITKREDMDLDELTRHAMDCGKQGIKEFFMEIESKTCDMK